LFRVLIESIFYYAQDTDSSTQTIVIPEKHLYSISLQRIVNLQQTTQQRKYTIDLIVTSIKRAQSIDKVGHEI
jgi:hypothetical protein